ncbi:endolytic transglycosylase MltG [Sutcliffiella horikoshii]|uniref:Endolytic transglycosylase MltG n=1 Tax=Sutcliffiella horikoshii TaxID=79883 RepID=A0AA94WR56_9BACI|nr:endolytic transglycosylase MltG [Sutcliffiella horikoshii]TYS59282.1 endolytic transglycosylase MltG [Sutcliffiella horikoshii]
MRTNLRAFAIGILFATGVMGVAYSVVSAGATSLNEESVQAYAAENDLHLLSKEEYDELLPYVEPVEEKKTEQKEEEVKEESKNNEEEAKEDTEVAEEQEETNEPFEIVIPDGMATYEITALLAREGIIEDDKKFDAYLEDKNIATKVRSGTFTMKKGMSYEEAADVLIK